MEKRRSEERRERRGQGGIEVNEFPENEVPNLHTLKNNSNRYKSINRESFDILYQDIGPFGINIYHISIKDPDKTNKLEELDLSGLSLSLIHI